MVGLGENGSEMRAAPNKSLHRTPAAMLSLRQRGVRPVPVSSDPLGSTIKSVVRACGESLVLRVRSHASLWHRLLPQHRPGPRRLPVPAKQLSSKRDRANRQLEAIAET